MKKKTIEKIPYLGLQKISRKKSAKYIGVTAIKIIGHKKHLLLEVYENKKESKKIPVVRITLTKKDFGTYWPDKNIWTRQQVSYYRPIWMETYTGGILTDENILQSPEDLERIKNFCGTKLFDASWWWEHISRYEADMAKYLDLTGLKYFITKRIGKTDISKIGDGTCTGAISALNQSLGNLKTDLNKLNSLGNISIMKMGTKILEILPGNNSCLLLSKNDVISALGLSSSTFNFDNLCVSITNGDGAAFSGHLESPTITTTGIYVVWKDKVTASCNIRVNYILFYHD